MLVTLSGIVMLASPEHPSNAQSPMLIRLLGIEMPGQVGAVKESVHPRGFVTVSGIVTLVRLVQ